MCEQCDQFVHLHVHSEYSLLDGLSRIADLASRAQALAQPALALTDHGAMFGTIDFYRTCKRVGVKPIIGMEGYVAARKMSDRDPQLDRQRFHLLLLARNQTGYLNLLRAASESQLNGYYYRPRIDHDFMAAHSAGLIATTGCMAAEVPRALDEGRTADAGRLLGMYLDIYGRDNLYIELQEHDIPALTQINRELIALAPRFGMQDRFLITNDVHYTTAAEADPHEVLLCIQTGSTTRNPKLTLSNKEYYLKSAAEMAQLFHGYPHEVVQNAFRNSLLVAEQCDVDLEMQGYHLPVFEVPAGFDPAGYMRHLCEEGLIWRYGAERAANDDGLRRRLDYELRVINSMGFDAYFLIVWDLCEFARRSRRWWERHGATFYPDLSYPQWAANDIWWNVRGSGAGSVVAYVLGITGIDPIANSLIFERFLNPGRISMPDFDLDYPDDRRHEMVEYAMRRYGAEKVAQIITFGTMKARAAIRDVGRAIDMPLADVDRIARLVPAIPGKKVMLDDLFVEGHEFYSREFSELYARDAAARQLIDTARQLEGVTRHASSHAAGVIIADRPLVEYVPLHRPTSGDAGLGGVDRVTQWPMEAVESIGLLKVDFLGLSTLTVMREAARLIEQRHGVRYEMDTIPYDVGHVGPDPTKTLEPAFEMLSRGEVGGVFQVEGAGMRRLMMDMKPSRFDHIIAAISLYRPGPMENIPEYIKRMHADRFEGRNLAAYHTPELEPILKDTYGVIVYQEQIIRMAAELAGYDPGEADMLRRAVAKKKEKEMEKHRAIFVDGAAVRGIRRAAAEAIWEDIKFFARYGFNKAHAADYAVITCQTAFLKAHYPVEYMAALLSVDREKTEKVTKYLAEARRMGITVAPPEINRARIDFVIEDTADGPLIRFGFGAIKNAGEGALQFVIDERDAHGAFRDIRDLCERVDLRRVGSRALESMIKVGVFDDWGTRPQLLDGLRRLIAYSGRFIDEKNSPQMTLFGLFDTPATPAAAPDLLHPADEVEAIDYRVLLDWEKELIGVYLSEHPLERKLAQLERYISHTSDEVDANLNGRPVALAGLLVSVRPYSTKKGDAMAFGVLEDLQGKLDLVFFPRTWEEVREVARVDQIVLVRGKVNVKGEDLSVIVDSLQTKFVHASAVEVDDLPPIDPQPSLSDYVMAGEEPDEDAGAPTAASPVAIVETDEWAPAAWDDLDEGADDEDHNVPLRPVPVVAPAPAAVAPVRVTRAAPPPPPPLDDEWPPEPPDFDMLPPLPPDDLPASEGKAGGRRNGNGQGAGNRRSADNGPRVANRGAPADNPSPRRAQTVVIEINPIGDWQATVRRSVRLAEEYEGGDRLALRLNGQPWGLAFPARRTLYCDELAAELRRLPGVQRVYASAE